MSSTITSNMGLTIPGVGTEAGPLFATDINQSLTVIDQHNHTAGSGVLITPSAININSALTFNSNFATNLAGLTLVAQSSTPANSTVYQSGVDLYYTDGNGANIRITQSGSVTGSAGTITGLPSGTASAAYNAISGTFVFQSATSTAANMDIASVILRNKSPNSTFGVTLNPQAAIPNNYSLTLPGIPASLAVLTIDNSGTIIPTHAVTGSNIAASTITGSNIANRTIAATNIISGSLTSNEIASNAGILSTQLAEPNAINPSQCSNLDFNSNQFYASAGPVTQTVSLFTPFSNNTSSSTQITSFNMTPAAFTPNRPYFLCFSNGHISMSTTPTGVGTNPGTLTSFSGIIRLVATDGTTSTDLASTQFDLFALNVGLPAAILNFIAFPATTFRTFEVWVDLNGSTNGGSSGGYTINLAISGVISQVFQV